MYKRDYIEEETQKLARMLAFVMGLKRVGKKEEATSFLQKELHDQLNLHLDKYLENEPEQFLASFNQLLLNDRSSMAAHASLIFEYADSISTSHPHHARVLYEYLLQVLDYEALHSIHFNFEHHQLKHQIAERLSS